jgi:hypothetical protein
MSNTAASLELVPPPSTPAQPEATLPPWSLPTRLVFRFFFCWLGLIVEPFPFRDLPGFRWIGWLADKALDKPFTWTMNLGALMVGYHGPSDPAPNGSGDQSAYWIQNWGCIVFALILTIAWSAVELRRGRRPRRYDRLYAFLRFWTRYYLAFTLMGYAFAKIFAMQMPVPTTFQLEEPFGDASPMTLLWTFMGASPAYEHFTGYAELAAGLLLLFRRTQLLGALTAAGVMLNVVLLNLCYDVPVKILSSTLLMMALFLVVYDLPRLTAVVLRRPSPPAQEPKPAWAESLAPRWRWALVAAEVVAAVLIMTPSYSFEHQRSRDFAADMQHPAPFEGRWAVERQVVDGRELPPLLSESTRWRSLIFSHYKLNIGALARRVDDTAVRMRIELDAAKHQMTLVTPHENAPPTRVVTTYTMADAEHMTISDEKKQLVLELRRLPPRKYLLLTRGFHWVNEEPFQR